MLLVPKIQTEWTQVDTGSMRAEVSVKIFSNQDHQELTRLLDNGDMPSKCIFQACSSRVSCCSFSFSASLFRFPPFGVGASSLTLNWVSIGFNVLRLQRKHAQTDLATARFRLWLSSLATSKCNGNMHKSQKITKHLLQNLRNIQFPIIVISCHSQFSTKYP